MGAIEGLAHSRVFVGNLKLGVEPENLAESVAEQVHHVYEAQSARHVNGKGPLKEHTEVLECLGLVEQAGVYK